MAISENQIKQIIDSLSFSPDGLIPVITQQYDTLEVLLLAWMNVTAIRETLITGNVCYWSRSRKKIWRKGEVSGQTQTLCEFRWDCDSDSILIMADQKGVACHTGRRTCFYKAFRTNKISKIEPVKIDPKILYKKDKN